MFVFVLMAHDESNYAIVSAMSKEPVQVCMIIVGGHEKQMRLKKLTNKMIDR